MKEKLNTKQGISLIVLIITLTSTYDERIKTDIKPPGNKIEMIIKNNI